MPCLMSKKYIISGTRLGGIPPNSRWEKAPSPNIQKPTVRLAAPPAGPWGVTCPVEHPSSQPELNSNPPGHALMPTPGTIFSAMCSAVWAFAMLPNNHSSQQMGLESECLESLQKQIIQKAWQKNVWSRIPRPWHGGWVPATEKPSSVPLEELVTSPHPKAPWSQANVMSPLPRWQAK